jgi:propanol-preferring alcohol dehydrogenase
VRALQIDEWGGELREVELADRELGPGEVRLGVLACGVGLTVLNAINGDLAGDGRATLPRVPGHEVCGEVLEVGPGVTAPRVGERGVVYFYLSCGSCRACVAGREPLCERLRGFVGVDIDGGYAERAVVPARNVVPIPDGIDPISATTIPDAIATPVHVCRSRGAVAPGEVVVVVGAGGGVGAHLVQVAGLFGAQVVAIDLTEEKLVLAREAGAWIALPAGSSPAEVAAAAGRPPDVVVDTVGSDATLAWSLSALGRGGRLVVLTTFPGVRVSETTARAVFDEIAIVGSRYASRADVALAIELVAEGRVRALVGAQASLSGVHELHERLRSHTLLGRGALVLSSALAPASQ